MEKGKIKKRIVEFGKKNWITFVLTYIVLSPYTFFLYVVNYFKNNTKRFSMLAMTFLLFAVYSSFSFPIFISDNKNIDWNAISEEAKNISLVQEEELNPDVFQHINDEEVLAEGEKLNESNPEDANNTGNVDFEIWETLPSSADREKDTVNSESSAYIDYEFKKDDWRIILVNKQNSIPADFSPKLGTIHTSKGDMQCDERIIEDLLAMFQAAKKDNVSLEIRSPYRDLEYQKLLFNLKITKYMGMGLSYMEAYQLGGEAVTVPGASEHQIGLALDIVTDSYPWLEEAFADTAAGKWLAANSYKYGFILRYPAGKESITCIEYEPWHFRYVGVEAATIITKEGITLEEFWEEYVDV